MGAPRGNDFLFALLGVCSCMWHVDASTARLGQTLMAALYCTCQVGVSRADSGLVAASMLEQAARRALEATAPRAMCVLRPLRVRIDSLPQGHVEELELQGRHGSANARQC